MSYTMSNFGKKHAYALIFAIALTLSLCVSFYVNYNLKHVKYQDNVYVMDQFNYGTWTFISEDGPDINVQNNDGYMSILSEITVTIKDDTYTYYQESLHRYIDLNGEIIDDRPMFSYTSVGLPEKSETQVFLDKIIQIIENHDTSYLVYMILMNLVLVALGTLNIVYPEVSWNLRMMFITRGGQPTDFYIAMTGIGGIILILVSIFYPLKLL